MSQYFGKSRSDDNENLLLQDSLHGKRSLGLKQISLNKNINLSLGGEVRYYYQNYQHVNFGEIPSNYLTESPDQLLQRILIQSNLTWKNKFRIFTQLNHTKRFFNPNTISSQTDEDVLSFQQLFAELHFTKNNHLRIGKQEEIYGGERLLAAREGPNTRMSHVGLNYRMNTKRFMLDAFWVRPMTMKPGVLDDEITDENIIGLYLSNVDFQQPYLFDFYSIYFQSHRREYLFKVGEEKRNSLGFRIF